MASAEQEVAASFFAYLATTLLTAMLACGATGWISSKTMSYYERYPDDDLIWKLTIGILCVLDMLGTALTCYAPYDGLIVHFGDYQHAMFASTAITTQATVTGVVTLITQVFFARRVLQVGKSKVIPCIIVGLGLISCGFAVSSTVMAFRLKLVYKLDEFKWGVLLWLCPAIIADLLIAGSLIYYVQRAAGGGSAPSSPELTALIRTVILQILETNSLTAVAALIDIGLYLGMPTRAWHLLVNLLLPKLYIFSVLVSLHTRSVIAIKIENLQESRRGVTTMDSVRSRTTLAVQVETEQVITSEKEEYLETDLNRSRLGRQLRAKAMALQLQSEKAAPSDLESQASTSEKSDSRTNLTTPNSSSDHSSPDLPPLRVG